LLPHLRSSSDRFAAMCKSEAGSLPPKQTM
jgi:hypothetical protein